jgi:acyl-CoA synthetase (AMP-forming)/AMP-acid ligase II
VHENVADLLVVAARRFGQRTAIVRGRQVRSFGELEDRAARVAGFLQRRGLGEGSRVGIAVRNSAEYIEALLGAAWVGALAVNVNYKYKAAELLHVLDDAGIDALVHDAAVSESLRGSNRCPRRTRLWIAALDASPHDASESSVQYSDVMGGARIDKDPSRLEGEWLMYTGGTTGLPKGVLSKHADLFNVLGRRSFDYLKLPTPASRAEFVEILDELSTEPEPRVVNLVAPPVMHATGTYATLGTLLTGGTVVYLSEDSFDPRDMAELLQRWSVTHLTIVGDAFARPLVGELRRAATDRHAYELSSLVCVHSVGAAWSTNSKAALLEFCDAEIEDILASTETGRYAAMVSRKEDGLVRNVLQPFPGVRVLNDDGTDVGAGSGDVGHLAVPVSSAVNYVGDGGSSSTFQIIDGIRYCLPGDLASVNTDGTFDLRGRHNRVINSGGEKVFAEEVEAVLLDHPEVRDALVVGRPDELWGSAVVAIIVPEFPEAPPSEQTMRKFVSNRLANYKSPKQVRIVREIPRVATGKADLRWADTLQW